jgi:hypothetical protein
MGHRGLLAYREHVARNAGELTAVINGRAARQYAAVFVILAAALWWHAWMPALLVVAFVAWAVLHTRYQGPRREGFMRLRRRVWPPASLVLGALIVAGTVVYWMSSAAIEAKVLPIALNVLAACAVVFGRWRRVEAS